MVSYRFKWCQKRIAKKKTNETIKRELLLNSLQENEDAEEK